MKNLSSTLINKSKNVLDFKVLIEPKQSRSIVYCNLLLSNIGSSSCKSMSTHILGTISDRVAGKKSKRTICFKF